MWCLHLLRNWRVEESQPWRPSMTSSQCPVEHAQEWSPQCLMSPSPWFHVSLILHIPPAPCSQCDNSKSLKTKPRLKKTIKSPCPSFNTCMQFESCAPLKPSSSLFWNLESEKWPPYKRKHMSFIPKGPRGASPSISVDNNLLHACIFEEVLHVPGR